MCLSVYIAWKYSIQPFVLIIIKLKSIRIVENFINWFTRTLIDLFVPYQAFFIYQKKWMYSYIELLCKMIPTNHSFSSCLSKVMFLHNFIQNETQISSENPFVISSIIDFRSQIETLWYWCCFSYMTTKPKNFLLTTFMPQK